MAAERPTPTEQINELFAEFKRNNAPTHDINAVDESDPDVRQLLLAFAHLTSELDEKIAYQNNDLYQMAGNALLGQLAYAKPQATMVQFEAFNDFPSPVLVKKGMRIAEDLDSVSQEERPQRPAVTYSTCYDFTLYPYRKQSCEFDVNAKTIRLSLQCLSPTPESLDISTLGLQCVSPDRPEHSAKIFTMLTHYLDKIVVRAHGQELSKTLKASALVPTGFHRSHGLFTQNPTESDIDNWGSYFLLPEKLQTLSLKCTAARHIFAQRSSAIIDIDFVLKDTNIGLSTAELESLRINSVVCANFFSESATPRIVNHNKSVIHLQSKNKQPIHSVAKVFGVLADETKRDYHDINDITIFSLKKTYAYAARLPNSANDKAHEVAIELAWGPDATMESNEAITAVLYCTHGAHQLAAPLSRPVLKSGVAQFETYNVGKTSAYVPGLNSLQAVSSVMEQRAVSQFTLQTAKQLRQYLQHIAALFTSIDTLETINNTIDAIRNVRIKHDSLLHNGRILYGQTVSIYLNHTAFVGVYNIYLFGYLLNKLYASFAPFNYYSKVVLNNVEATVLFEYDVQIGTTVVSSV